MKIARRPALLIALGLLMLYSAPASRAADDAKVEGSWKFILIPPLQELDFLVMDVGHGDAPTVQVKTAQPLFQNKPTIVKFSVKGDDVRFAMKLDNQEHPFVGRLDKGGDVLGTLRLQGNLLPARLEKSPDGQIKPFGVDQKLSRAYITARQDKDPKARADKLAALLIETGDSPKGDAVFADLLSIAERAGLSEEQVRGHVSKWLAIAKPYGEIYTASVQAKIGKALAGQKPYANLAFEMATDADKALGDDAPASDRAAAARNLATAASLAGKADIAAKAEAKADALDTTLDEEYRKTVPPFEPTPYLGRKTNGADRVVLMEIFTGAECPPCVAADVAFDAILHAYKPSEVIGLQYHLHIPGPDPLTNKDTVARAEDYPNIQGTPSVFLNGKIVPGGGGPMAASKGKFHDYAEAINKELEGNNSATIALKAERSGDDIKISAKAEAKDAKPDAKLKLRLALVEEEVRHPGGNKLRLHHHVVRAMPGGVSGQAMADGKGQFETTVSLAKVREELESYLSDFARNGGGFSSRPKIALEKLSVVAFVQDDGDKSVLHAVTVPVGRAKP